MDMVVEVDFSEGVVETALDGGVEEDNLRVELRERFSGYQENCFRQVILK